VVGFAGGVGGGDVDAKTDSRPAPKLNVGAATIVPTLCVGMHPVTLRVTLRHLRRDAERPGRHSHAERGNDR
ncbi:hypothetical protein GIW27_28020, partial [Pseudomonas sp. PA-5-4A]|nr:hypothetical protein [Pseudomonas sp. PA-5-4A]